MNFYRRLMGGCIWATAAALLSLTAATTWAEATSKPAAKEAKAETKTPALESLTSSAEPRKEAALSNVGTVTGNDVYVRSGFHQNYYPVTKLNKGDKVTVLGEEYGWLKVAPPAGTYSLVEKALIDKVDDQSGKANGEATVYAGSNLNDRRYAKQVRLAKGDKVQLIGETSDGGFYKIQPPAGAVLWIKADLVDRGGKGETPIEKVNPGELTADTGTAATTKPSGEAKGPGKSTTAAKTGLAKASETQMDINAVEALVAAETTKPFNERSFEPIIAKLRPLAEQSSDPVAQEYAKIRIKQLNEETELVKAYRGIREDKEKAISDADRIAIERSKIKVAEAAPMDDIAVRGEIRVSTMFDGRGGKPQRWRIVSPGDERTVAFIELPQGSPIDPVQYYGKYVGIRASGRQLMQSTSPPLPIYTVKEILVQDPMAARKAEVAGGNPPVVPAPSSQPSASESTTSQPASETPAQGPDAKPTGEAAK